MTINMIMQSDFNGKNIKSSWDKNKCSCLYGLEESSFMQIDTSNVSKPLIY